ncbi:MAG TPA: VOC family protein [Bryobacteraceae bacterium]|nr:VOC family protein [Bryobacteraceae bacterium]
MPIELDHLFVCTDVNAPCAQRLIELGFTEGPSNTHPGQGTANRRFFFANAMIELIWVSDASEAQSPKTRRTLLWERWSGRKEQASPFGICMRPAGSEEIRSPFPGWEYRPDYLPTPAAFHIGDAGITEPMWIYLSFLRQSRLEQNFFEHQIGVREITGLTLTTPFPLQSPASQAVIESSILTARSGGESLIEIEFDHARREKAEDLRPHLPLILRV